MIMDDHQCLGHQSKHFDLGLFITLNTRWECIDLTVIGSNCSQMVLNEWSYEDGDDDDVYGDDAGWVQVDPARTQ